MALISELFRSNPRLQQCAINDPAHVTPGSQGDFVQLIQKSLIFLENADIADGEYNAQSYGKTTADAVLAFKKRRGIINHSYQSTEDNIVGKMTIQRLDQEQAALEAKASIPEDRRRWAIKTAHDRS